MEGNRMELEHHTAALDRFNEVLGALSNETESRLVCVELQNAAQRLLRHHREIVGVVYQHPGDGVLHRSPAPNKFSETLSDRRYAAVVGAGKTERHRGLMFGIRDTLRGQLLGDPGVCHHRLADTGGAPEYQMWRCLESLFEKRDCCALPENAVH